MQFYKVVFFSLALFFAELYFISKSIGLILYNSLGICKLVVEVAVILEFTKQFSLKMCTFPTERKTTQQSQYAKCKTFISNLILIFWPCIGQPARGVGGIARVGDHPQHRFPGLLRGKKTFHDGHHPVAPIRPRDVDRSPVEQKQNDWYSLC